MSTHPTDRTAATDEQDPATDDRAASAECDPTGSGQRPSTGRDQRSTTPGYPDADPVGPHLVIDRTEWIPGADPEPHMRHHGQRAYRESYLRCIKCGAERQAKEYFPEQCEGDPTSGDSIPD